jgi:hypothetical protein
MVETVGMVSTWGRELTPRMMAADRPYDVFCDYYSVSPEYIGYILVQNCRRPLLRGAWTSHIM